MVSLVDRYGVRHQIDLEAWVSFCCEWVVRETDGSCSGTAERHVETQTAMPVHELGSMRTHYVAGRGYVRDEEATFGESDEPITCLTCVAGPQ